MNNPLLDTIFLKKLFSQKTQEKFVKIVALDMDENPVEEIQGRATGGSINIDGSSAARRSCSLTLTATELNIHDYYWGLKTKFVLSVGLKNRVDSNYEDIIWFKKGTFLITSFNTSQSTNSYQVSIQGKDKMSLLNGEIGGNITSVTQNFAKIDRIGLDGTITTESYLIKDIIREGVHEFGNEPYYNIIINDLDEAALMLLNYINLNKEEPLPIYIFYSLDGSECKGVNFLGEFLKRPNDDSEVEETELNFGEDFNFYKPYNGFSIELEEPDTYLYNGEECLVSKIEQGQVAGYKVTDFTYAKDGKDDLIGSLGNAFTAECLDKLVGMLGDYEYFYDEDGRFIFQKKRTFINTTWNNLIKNEDEEYAENSMQTSQQTWFFEDGFLITSFQNNPNYKDLKNDFVVWGARGSDSSKIAIHMRYAIDKKPVYYKAMSGVQYVIDKDYVIQEDDTSYKVVDWREIIYQMAFDYHHGAVWGEESVGPQDLVDTFLVKVARNNPDYYPLGYTGYEKYYTDIYSFWRDLYDIDNQFKYSFKVFSEEGFQANKENIYYYLNCEKATYDSSKDYYYINMKLSDHNNYKQVNSMTEEKFNNYNKDYYTLESAADEDFDSAKAYYFKTESDFVQPTTLDDGTLDYSNCWNKNYIENPQDLLFWFDFMDTTAEINKYSVYNVGDRPKAENNDKLKSIYYGKIPSIIFSTQEEYDALGANVQNYSGYDFFIIEEEDNVEFGNSGQGASIKERIDSLLYQYTYCVEQITLQCLPIYHLQPNTRIFVRDDKTGINGDYIIKSLSIPLAYNGMMSITATKAVERLY